MPTLWKAPRTPALQPLLAFLAFLALALSWSLGTPLLSAADEPEHVVKAAAAVRGEFSGTQNIEHFVGWQRSYTTPDYLEVTYRLPQSLVAAREANEPCYAFHLDVAANCLATANKAATLAAGDTSTSHMDYFPLYYLAVGWPSLILNGDAAIYGMRIVSAIISALMLAAAFTTSIRRRGAAALGVLAAATPVAVYYGAVVNPSGLEISSAVLAWASLLSIVRAEPGRRGCDAIEACSPSRPPFSWSCDRSDLFGSYCWWQPYSAPPPVPACAIGCDGPCAAQVCAGRAGYSRCRWSPRASGT